VEVLVVAPALGGRLERWASDDRPRRAAEERLGRCLTRLRAAGIRAEGLVGDDDPLLAIDEALRLFDADAIVVATRPERRSGRVALDLVERARRRYAQRVRHVVVGLGDSDVIAA
jgi:GABA permease